MWRGGSWSFPLFCLGLRGVCTGFAQFVLLYGLSFAHSSFESWLKKYILL